jgi:surface protein
MKILILNNVFKNKSRLNPLPTVIKVTVSDEEYKFNGKQWNEFNISFNSAKKYIFDVSDESNSGTNLEFSSFGEESLSNKLGITSTFGSSIIVDEPSSYAFPKDTQNSFSKNSSLSIYNPPASYRTYSDDTTEQNSVLGSTDGGWTSLNENTESWMTIELKNGPILVSGVVTQGKYNSDSTFSLDYVSRYKIQYSLNNVDYFDVGEFYGNIVGSVNETKRSQFENPVNASFIRIIPLVYNTNKSMRVGLVIFSNMNAKLLSNGTFSLPAISKNVTENVTSTIQYWTLRNNVFLSNNDSSFNIESLFPSQQAIVMASLGSSGSIEQTSYLYGNQMYELSFYVTMLDANDENDLSIYVYDSLSSLDETNDRIYIERITGAEWKELYFIFTVTENKEYTIRIATNNVEENRPLMLQNIKLSSSNFNNNLFQKGNGTIFASPETVLVGYKQSINGVIYEVLSQQQFVDKATTDANWNTVVTSFVTDMSEKFKYIDYFNADISSWDTANVTNMRHMFYGANKFDYDIELWNTSNVTDMSQMIEYAEPIIGPEITSETIQFILNSDGTRILVYSPNKVECFEYSNYSWIQLGSTISTGNWIQPSMDASGNTISIATTIDNSTSSSFVYNLDDTNEWQLLGGTSFITGGSKGSNHASKLSGNGQYLWTTGWQVNGAGNLQKWNYDGTSWINTFVINSPRTYNIDVSYDGSVLVGTSIASGGHLLYDFFVCPPASTSIIKPVGISGNAISANLDCTRVAMISGDGQTVRVYDKGVDWSTWTLIGREVNLEYSISKIALSDDGSRFVIGAPDWDSPITDDAGIVQVYELQEGIWTMLFKEMGITTNEMVGNSVDISQAGTVITNGIKVTIPQYSLPIYSTSVIYSVRITGTGVDNDNLPQIVDFINFTGGWDIRIDFDPIAPFESDNFYFGIQDPVYIVKVYDENDNFVGSMLWNKATRSGNVVVNCISVTETFTIIAGYRLDWISTDMTSAPEKYP